MSNYWGPALFPGTVWLIGGYIGVAVVLAVLATRGQDVQPVPHVSIYLIPSEENLHDFPPIVSAGASIKYVLGGEYFDSEETSAILTVDVMKDDALSEIRPQLISREERITHFEPGMTWTNSVEVALSEPGSYVIENRLQLDDPTSSPVTVRLRLLVE